MENNQVQALNNKELTIDSREVAEMVGKSHSALLKDLNGSKDGKSLGIIPILQKSNFDLSRYFIKSTYKSGTREYVCYLCTKMGCEMIGNKQQGEKGILFTAKYVERFNEMEEKIKNQNSLVQGNQAMFFAQNIEQIATTMAQFMKNTTIQFQQIKEQTKGEVKEIVKDSIIIKDQQIEQTAQLIGLRTKNTRMLVSELKDKLKDLTGCKITAKDNIYEKAKNKLFKEFGVIAWEDISIGKFNAVHSFIDGLEKEHIGFCC
ncbi:Rha family transcriptional regulator (plasmid) [Clostridium botulinum]|uniref:Rha family transcriptional regulator n=1 Tax=Clostridium botulinum TaxID=1491 RepID=UPI0006A4D3BC|nr:Rha family transcriptional regulator [Clostridium botulinum]KOC56891.1 antirepressor [Clostridium botulinum]KOC57366.1 antirepressor [Clostridium botulinum]MCD3232600.1 Rha family transcriptional regulator [Clostridium botulinum D/C]MCD3238471.1 Rha family transcriptional regulator [Clostridium botulinum D/C]MCD3266009.1 Rha family transcriptional regulator [Clostridium botulinum D/C]